MTEPTTALPQRSTRKRTREIQEDLEDDTVVESRTAPSESPPFVPGQSVWARDPDGLLYRAFIRRSIYGVPRRSHKQLQIGFIASQEEMERELKKQEDDEENEEWFFFVHYSQWKPNWDRWVSLEDVMEDIPANAALAEKVAEAHRELQREFKQKQKQPRKKIDGGAFLKAWRIKLDQLLGNTDRPKQQPQKKKTASAGSTIYNPQEWKLRESQLLMTRKPTEIQQITLALGLKRALVEEWEILGQFDMVHPIPARVTVRQALQRYLDTKGIATHHVNGKLAIATSSSTSTENEGSDSGPSLEANVPPAPGVGMEQEWIDMANGICILFNQALSFRLLYPCERSQLAVLQQSDSPHADVPLADLYGCEYLLRLFCQLPTLLRETYLSKSNDQDLDGEDLVKSILAKVNDFCRFLQKHQDDLVQASFRKKNDAECKWEQREKKRLERKMQQELAAGSSQAQQ